jgi:4'-phosphopantetheinyl transferase
MSADAVQVWWSRLDGVHTDRFERMLSPQERERAAGFHRQRDGRRFVVARGLLYTLLGERLGIDPARVELALGEHGKPRLAGDDVDLRFNVSHSGGVVAVALCEGREVGVDVELIRGDLATEAIAKRYLPRDTVREIELLGIEERPRAFFRAWVRLEAHVKAHGGGLGLLDELPGPEGWAITDLALPDGYAGALAVEGDLPDRVVTEELNLDPAGRVLRPLSL